jgi:hypothetical protein
MIEARIQWKKWICNVTLAGILKMADRIPCFLCSQKLEIRKDRKHSKPYFICDACGLQAFVRGEQGIKNLADLIAMIREHDFPFREHAAILFEIQALLTEIRGVKKEIEKLDSVFEIFSKDEHRERARQLLHQRIETLLERLERIANGHETR